MSFLRNSGASFQGLGCKPAVPDGQAQGKEADQRNDIWSLGVFLYELLAGKVPFVRKTMQFALNVDGAVLNKMPK